MTIGLGERGFCFVLCAPGRFKVWEYYLGMYEVCGDRDRPEVAHE